MTCRFPHQHLDVIPGRRMEGGGFQSAPVLAIPE
jgi:hypothetical protein